MKLADRWWWNVGLAGLVAALILVAFFEPGKDAERDAGKVHEVFAGAAGAMSLKITSAAKGTVELVKRNDAWQIVAPFEAPADPNIMKTLIDGLAEKSDARYPAAEIDATAAGLATPDLTLELDGMKYEFGGQAPISYKRYLRAGDAVFLIDEMNRYRLDQPATYFVERRLLPEGAEIASIELPDAKLARGADGKWTLAPEDARVSADALQKLVDEWRTAAAMEAKPYAGEVAQGKVKVTLADGTAHEFEILAGDDATRLGRRDRGLVYELLSNARRGLLTLERVDPAKALTAGDPPAAQPKPDAAPPKTK
jgi:hypothetical protein